MKTLIRNIIKKRLIKPNPLTPGDNVRPLGIFSYRKNIIVLALGVRQGISTLQLLKSKDGATFSLWRKKVTISLPSGKKEKVSQCHTFTIVHEKDSFSMNYIRDRNGRNELVFATSKNLTQWHIQGTSKTKRDHDVIVPDYMFDDHYIQYFGVGDIHVASSKDGTHWRTVEKEVLTPRAERFDNTPLSMLGATEMHRGIFALYDASHQTDSGTRLQIGGVLFASDDPKKVTWRSDTALWEADVEHSGEVVSLGAILHGDEWYVYWVLPDNKLIMVALPDPFLATDGKSKKRVNICRFKDNPILSPLSHNDWESDGTFNTAAVYLDGKVHFLYRAVGRNGISVLGYASSSDGFTIDARGDKPAYIPRMPFEGAHMNRPTKKYDDLFLSGYSWGGCEDPKMVVIDDRVYLTYVAHAGWPPRTAISWISVEDFLAHRWEKWSEPQLLSPPGMDSKSACLLPEKVNGKYIMFHRTWPDIVIEEFDDLDFSSDEKWLQSTPAIPMWRANGKCVIMYGTWPDIFTEHTDYTSEQDLQQSPVWKKLTETGKRISVRHNAWDSHKISMGAPPIKTKDGWLALYSAVDQKDLSQYKIGAMLLDKDDPSKVLHRSNAPILSPEEPYENDYKPGVIYPSGAVTKNDELLVYYGGGDKHTCVASAPLTTFLDDLKNQLNPSLQNVSFA